MSHSFFITGIINAIFVVVVVTIYAQSFFYIFLPSFSFPLLVSFFFSLPSSPSLSLSFSFFPSSPHSLTLFQTKLHAPSVSRKFKRLWELRVGVAATTVLVLALVLVLVVWLREKKRGWKKKNSNRRTKRNILNPKYSNKLPTWITEENEVTYYYALII